MGDLIKTCGSLPIGASILEEVRQIIRTGQKAAYGAVNSAMILTYWNVGKQIISILSQELTKEFGSGYSERNLRNCRKFYMDFPDSEIWNACVPNLNWTHFRTLLREDNENARLWYMNEAYQNGWSTRTLDRNISTQYYYRLLRSPEKEALIAGWAGVLPSLPDSSI